MTYVWGGGTLSHGTLCYSLQWCVAATTTVCSVFGLPRFVFSQTLLQIGRRFKFGLLGLAALIPTWSRISRRSSTLSLSLVEC